MKKILVDKVTRIIKAKKRLEEKLKVKITNRGKEFYLEGKPIDEYFADLIITAFDFGFRLSDAMLIKDQDFIFEILNIKDYTKRNDLERVRARIIGKEGKTINTLRSLTKCAMELNENNLGIIGAPESIPAAQQGAISLIQGSKQSNVYSFLEKHHPEPVEDLGLREGFK